MKTMPNFPLLLCLGSSAAARERFEEWLPDKLRRVNAKVVRVEGGSFFIGWKKQEKGEK